MLQELINETEVCVCIDGGIARDDQSAIENKLLSLVNDSKCNIVITSGGVSMGNRDFIKPLLEKIGTVHFGRMLMKPGLPTTFATVHKDNQQNTLSTLVFALPGNPVSCYVTFHLLVLPAIWKIAGLPTRRWTLPP
ncbi:molybdopterin biosynthesis protein, partial [Reticulomyxa filosa]